MPIQTEPLLNSSIFLTEDAAETMKYSRDAITLISGQNLVAGTVLGAISLASATSAVKASGANTGTGTLVMDSTTPVLANAETGIYTVRCIIAGVNTGTFIVTNPTGRALGEPIIVAGAGGTITFADQIKFVITDGGTDFVVGDGFDITVAAGSSKYTILAPAALDGSQNVAGVLMLDCNATSADTAGVAIGRKAIVKAGGLTWPGGITTPQKTAAIAQLKALGILVRTDIGTAATGVVG